MAQPRTNIIEIANTVYSKLIQIKKDVPQDINWSVDHDFTKYVRVSIGKIQQTLFIAVLLIFIIIFIFLRDWYTTLILIVTIPISLVGSFF